MPKSEQYKIAQMQTARDIVLGALDTVTRNPAMGVLATIFVAEAGQRMGWIAPSTKSTLVGSLVAGQVLAAIGGRTQGNAYQPSPLPTPLDIVTKGATKLGKLAVKGVKAGVKKYKSKRNITDAEFYEVPDVMLLE